MVPDGRPVGDDQGNLLSISAIKGDLKKIKLLQDAAAYHGVHEGSAVFLSGRRKVTDEEYEEQKLRMAWGLLPDEYDVAALAEEQRYHQKYD